MSRNTTQPRDIIARQRGVVEKAENESVQGDMPRGRVIGYIFHDSFVRKSV